MQSRLLLFVLFLLSTSVVLAQNNVRVTVLEKGTHDPVMLAYVNVYDGTNNSMLVITEQTNELGVATVVPDKYPIVIEVTSLGYESYKQTYYTKIINPNLTVYLEKKFSSMNEVVVTGTTRPKRMKDALSTYQVITSEQIRAMGAVTLDQALRNQINTQISNDAILGTSVQVQGQTANRVKILIDGVPLNGRENGSINLSQINMNNVDHIEVVQGPMSVSYGTDALGGVINVITKKNNKPFGIQVNTYYETVGRYNMDASATYKLNKRHQFTIGGGRNYFQGWGYLEDTLKYNQNYIILQRERAFKPNDQYLGNFAYNYTAASGFSLNAASDFIKDKVTNKQTPTWDPFESSAYDEYYHTNRSMNRLGMNGKAGKSGHWQSQNGYNLYHRIRNTYKVDMTTLEAKLSEVDGVQDTSTFHDVSSRSSYTNNFKSLTYTAGYDVNLSFAHSQKIPGNNTEIHDYAAFTNISLSFLKDKITTQAGLRASHNTSYQAPLIPSFNLLYNPAKNVQIRGSYAKGFRAPSLKELYLEFVDLNHYITGNPNLKAETSHHLQTSVSYQAYEKRSNYLQFIFSGFYNHVQNGIVLIPKNPNDPNSIEYYYGNLFRNRNVIATIQADGQIQELHFQLGYSRNYTLPEGNFYDAFNAGEATALLQYNFRKAGLNLNLIDKYTSAQPIPTLGIDGVPRYMIRQKAYHMLDLTAEKSLWHKKLQIIAGVKNVMDVRYVTQSSTGGTGNTGGHGTAAAGVGSFLPRSLFTSLRLSID